MVLWGNKLFPTRISDAHNSPQVPTLLLTLLCLASGVWAIKQSCSSDVCLSVAYIGSKSRTERPEKTKIGTAVAHVTSAHVTRDSDTISMLKGQRSTCWGRGHIVAADRTTCWNTFFQHTILICA